MNAADYFTATAARIVRETGCSVDAALTIVWDTISARPELAAMVLTAVAEKVAA